MIGEECYLQNAGCLKKPHIEGSLSVTPRRAADVAVVGAASTLLDFSISLNWDDRSTPRRFADVAVVSSVSILLVRFCVYSMAWHDRRAPRGATDVAAVGSMAELRRR